MAKIITVTGQKGGSGKSVAALNLAASLAVLEKKTLLIDCDPSACVTRWMGIDPKSYRSDLASVLSGRSRIEDAITDTSLDYLDIIPSGFTLFQAALRLAKHPGNEKLLGLLLKDIEDQYEFILMDPPPSFSFLSIAAMTAAQSLIMCISPRINDLDDFHMTLKMVKYIKKTHDIPLMIIGILFNRCRTQDDIPHFLEQQNLQDIQPMVLNHFIPEDPAIPAAAGEKLPVILNDIKSRAAESCLNAALELHDVLSKRGGQ